MTDYELMLIVEAYKDIKKREEIMLERQKQSNGNNTDIINAPITIKDSRFNMPKIIGYD